MTCGELELERSGNGGGSCVVVVVVVALASGPGPGYVGMWQYVNTLGPVIISCQAQSPKSQVKNKKRFFRGRACGPAACGHVGCSGWPSLAHLIAIELAVDR